jgi:hypothetical protein
LPAPLIQFLNLSHPLNLSNVHFGLLEGAATSGLAEGAATVGFVINDPTVYPVGVSILDAI